MTLLAKTTLNGNDRWTIFPFQCILKTLSTRFGTLTMHFNETKYSLKTISKSLQNIWNAFWNIDNTSQRIRKSIENHFEIITRANKFGCVNNLGEIFTTFRLSRALKPSSKQFQFLNNGQYKAFCNVATILSAQKRAYVVPFCVVKTLHVKGRMAPYLSFVTFIVTKKFGMLNHLVSKFSIMQAFNIPSCYIFPCYNNAILKGREVSVNWHE